MPWLEKDEFDYGWNDKHVNEVKYPDNPDLEQALMNFRQQYTWFEQQTKYRKRGIDTAPVQDAWNYFLKLRNQNERRTNS